MAEWVACRGVSAAHASGFAKPGRVSAAIGKNDVPLNKRITALPASAISCRNAPPLKIMPGMFSHGSLLLGSAVMVAPSGDKFVQKIIGRSCRWNARLRGRDHRLCGLRFAFAVFHQPAREHGAGVLFHPLIYQRGNFLSQIGRMAEPRKLIALQTVARCGKQEFPRRRNSAAIHETPWVGKSAVNSNLLVIIGKGK